MATATQKITLACARDIPFNKLTLSQSNVRRLKAGQSIEELAESIARRGLIQSLHVRSIFDAEGVETGMFEVPAGGRRYRALELLVKQKRLNKTAPVPCTVSEARSDILVDEISLAENIERAPLHPLDQFRAFQAMREKGMTEEAIAAAFFVGANVVKQRLRLVAVAQSLLDVYAGDGMTLEQLMAFTVSPDHARQEQVWDAVRNGWQKEPYHIRRMLTESAVRAADKRALFVGVEAYEAAGGVVMRDLFQSDDGGWLRDVALLDRLASEKLKAAAGEVAAEGWKWIEAAIGLPYGVTFGLRQVSGARVDLNDDERNAMEALQAERDQLEAQYEAADEMPEDADRRLGEIDAELDKLDNPRKAMGDLLGHAVRFGPSNEIMAVGEGVETMLSLKCVLPNLTVAAALSAAHLAAFLIPPSLRRLYIARDNDPAGDAASGRLIERARRAEIDAIVLSPRLGDFNDDLTTFGMTALRADIRRQLAPEDAARFMRLLA